MRSLGLCKQNCTSLQGSLARSHLRWRRAQRCRASGSGWIRATECCSSCWSLELSSANAECVGPSNHNYCSYNQRSQDVHKYELQNEEGTEGSGGRREASYTTCAWPGPATN